MLLVSCVAGAAVPDAGAIDASSVASDADASSRDAVSFDSGCDVGVVPGALPALGGRFVVLEPDAGSPIPAQAGGRPIAVWRVEDVTAFAGASTSYDLAASSITGTGWVVVASSEVRLALDLDLALASPGRTTHVVESHALRGPYAWSGVTVHVTPTCAMPAVASLDVDFTSGDSSGTLVLDVNSAVGPLTLLLRCQRTST